MTRQESGLACDPANLIRERTFSQAWGATTLTFVTAWRQWVALGVIALGPPMLAGLLLVATFDFDALFAAVRLITAVDAWQLTLSLVGPRLLISALGWAYTLIVFNGAGSILAAQVLAGQPAELRAALRTAFTRRAGALIGGNLTVAPILAIVLLVIGSIVGVLGILFTLYMAAAWLPLLNPLLALERGPLGRLLSRAWYFGRWRFGRVLVVLLVLGAVLSVVSLPIQWLGDQLAAEAPSLSAESGWVWAEGYWLWRTGLTLLNLLVQSVILPIGVILFTVLYGDARARLDVPPEDATAPDEVSEPPADILSLRDLGNLIGLAAVVLVIGLLSGAVGL